MGAGVVSRSHFYAYAVYNLMVSPTRDRLAPWRSGYAEVCKTFYTGSIPVGASSFYVARRHKGKWWNGIHGGLKIRCPNRLEGSSPSFPTSCYMSELSRSVLVKITNKW